jgi:hypothetical protein
MCYGADFTEPIREAGTYVPHPWGRKFRGPERDRLVRAQPADRGTELPRARDGARRATPRVMTQAEPSLRSAPFSSLISSVSGPSVLVRQTISGDVSPPLVARRRSQRAPSDRPRNSLEAACGDQGAKPRGGCASSSGAFRTCGRGAPVSGSSAANVLLASEDSQTGF